MDWMERRGKRVKRKTAKIIYTYHFTINFTSVVYTAS